MNNTPTQFAAIAASTIYVSLAGNDAADGTTPERPLRHIQAAARRARAGSTILIAPGQYQEQLVVTTSGSPGLPITFQAAGPGVVLDGSNLGWVPASNQNQGLVELRASFVRLDGLQVLHSLNTGILLAGDHLTVERCVVASCQRHAISTETSRQLAGGGTMIQDILLKDNVIHHATLAGNGFGQPISLIADGFVVVGNELYANHEIPIDLWLGASHGEVAGNSIHDNAGQTGIYVDGASTLRIHGNRVFRNLDGIGVSSEDRRYSSHDIWVYNNLVYDNSNIGCYLWNPPWGVLERIGVAFNTLVGNRRSLRLSGPHEGGQLINNLGCASGGPDLEDDSRSSNIVARGNVWLKRAEGFVDPVHGDFRLTASSLAIGAAIVAPQWQDDEGRTVDVSRDFAGRDRAREAPAAGAFAP